MTGKNSLGSIFQEHKTLFVIVAVGLFLIEIEIFALAAMKSGRESRMQVLGTSGSVIYEADGSDLSQFNKYYFEKTFGPMDRFDVRLVTFDRPFPFRAWFVAAVGIPVGVVLLFGFVVRAYLTLFYGESGKQDAGGTAPKLENPAESRFERIVRMVSRFNIFVIGALVMLAVLAYWVVPNLVTHLGRVGIETLIRYKWAFASLALGFLVLVAWIIYLRYLLAKKAIDGQVEVDKYRLRLEAEQTQGTVAQLSYNPSGGSVEGNGPGHSGP